MSGGRREKEEEGTIHILCGDFSFLLDTTHHITHTSHTSRAHPYSTPYCATHCLCHPSHPAMSNGPSLPCPPGTCLSRGTSTSANAPSPLSSHTPHHHPIHLSHPSALPMCLKHTRPPAPPYSSPILLPLPLSHLMHTVQLRARIELADRGRCAHPRCIAYSLSHRGASILALPLAPSSPMRSIP